MAFHKHNATKKTYLKIIGGAFAQDATKDTPGAIKRFSEKKGIDVYEVYPGNPSGLIKGLSIDRDGKYGEQLIINIDDVGEEVVVKIPVESKYFDSFCSHIGQVQISQDVLLSPYQFTPKDSETKKIGMNLFQKDGNGEFKVKVGYHFTKEEPWGKPMPTEEKMSEKEWKKYKIDEREFFCKYIQGFGMNKPVSSSEGPPIQNNETTIETRGANTTDLPQIDDLPFILLALVGLSIAFTHII